MKNVLLILLFGLSLAACTDTKPKDLTNKNKLGFGGDNDTTTPEAFKFNFAYIDSAAAAPMNRIVFLQGAADTKTPIISTCNAAGTNCVCEFLDSSDNELEESSSSEISYDTIGNYLRCEFDGTLASLAKVRVRNQNSTVESEVFTLETPSTLTAAKLLGEELDLNVLRGVYRYSCQFNYLQKAGTSPTIFDCSNQASLCGSSAPNGNFCILRATYPYYLFSSNNASNFDQKRSDQLYNEGSNLCSLYIKQFDCVATGIPARQFGLYGEQKGVFELGIQVSAGPGVSAVLYGYAAKTSTFNGSTVCPPGLERRVFYHATVAQGGWIDSNISSTLSSEVAAPGSVPANLPLARFKNATCNGTSCNQIPVTADGNITTFPYTLGTEGEFCVVPLALLP